MQTAPSAPGMPKSATNAQSVNYQANVEVFAQQARERRLKLKQAANKAEAELDRLKGVLNREQALQVLQRQMLTAPHRHMMIETHFGCIEYPKAVS